MRNWPTWIPNVNAWINAILLLLLVRGIELAIEMIFEIDVSLKLQLILYFSALLSPIFVIAIAHHWLHVFLDSSFPNTRSPEMGKTEGIFPGLISWWEGLYSWNAIALALLIINAINLIFLIPFDSLSSISNAINLIFLIPFDSLSYSFNCQDQVEKEKIFTLLNLIRLTTIAYLYQFENIVRNHLMSVGSRNSSS